MRMTWIVFNFFPKPTNSNIDGPYITKVVIAPNRLQEVLTVNYLSNMFCKVVEEFKFTVS